ncbi:hypothetical protein BFJ69_g17267 [Fusarium oxysporum]|uniref:Uncharacterized protein n=1 Tax=Fusarium oxysporum TaxID=5507 RepID=A0A420M8R1_FUSOX|nr:hypothetical protein BFJ69_g17267 [Fusarium oxysporum]
MYGSKKDEVKQELSDALTRIHIGFDMWTSPNRHAVMAVTAHFLDRRREDDLRHWRKKGPVGKLHNVVKFIRSSPQRCELFKRISRENDEAQEYLLASESTAELEIVMNNDTR